MLQVEAHGKMRDSNNDGEGAGFNLSLTGSGACQCGGCPLAPGRPSAYGFESAQERLKAKNRLEKAWATFDSGTWEQLMR